MPKEIKTTIAVDGEAAFKRAINDATTSIRNMGTQLTLAQAQFKKDGDAMKLMETRSKALKGEISQQEEIVKALEKAVTDSSKAYGENSDKTEKWQAELNRAKAKLANLQSELTLNEQGLDRNGKAFDEGAQHAADYQATLQTIGKNVSFQTVSEGIKGITGTIEGAIKKVWNFAKSLKDAMVDSGKWADDLITDATKYKMSTEELQRWRYASKFVDTEVETIYNARQKLTNKISKGWKDGDLDMWQVLGIDLNDAETGKARNKMDIMWEVGETLLNISKMQEQGSTNMDAEALSMEVFGKSWRDLLPLFTAGREAWEKYMGEATVVSDENVHALGDSYDAVERLESSWETLKLDFFAQIAPTMTEVTDALSGMLREFNAWIETDEGKQAMSDLSEAIKELFSGISDIKFKDVIETVKSAINGIKDALSWLAEHKDDVKTALEVIAIGFGGLKVAELALNIGKIVSGFQTLWAGANKPLPSLPGTGGTPTTAPTTGGNDVTGTAVKVGIGARIAKWLPALADFGLGLGVETAVVAAAVTPALIAQEENNKQWRAKQNERLEAAEELALKGSENAEFVREAALATGLQLDESGEEKKNVIGQSYTTMTDSHYDLLTGLQSRQGMERAKLALALMNGDYSITAGNDTWQLLQRYWSGEALDPYVVDELLENVTDALIDQEKRGLPSMLPGEMPEKEEENAAETAAEEMTTAAETLKEIGEESKRGVANGKAASFLDLDPEQQANWILASLGDVKNRGKLHSDIGLYGDENDNINGWSPWAMLMRYWGEYTDEQGRPQDMPLEQSDLNGLVEYLRNLEIEKLQSEQENDLTGNVENALDDAVAQMKVNTEASKTASEKIASADFKKFNSLPSELQKAAQAGTSAGVSGIRVYMDGSTVGRLVAPYVSAYIAQNAV